MLFNSIKQWLILSPILFSSCVENQWVPPEKLHEPFVRPAEELILTINDLLGFISATNSFRGQSYIRFKRTLI